MINKLLNQPPAFWVSIAALIIAILSLVLSRLTKINANRLLASEKRTQLLCKYTEMILKANKLYDLCQDSRAMLLDNHENDLYKSTEKGYRILIETRRNRKEYIKLKSHLF